MGDGTNRGVDWRYTLICRYVPVPIGMLPGSGGGTMWEHDEERPSSLSSSHCLLLLAYRIPPPLSDMVHPINSMQQHPLHPQQQHHDDHGIETQIAIQRHTQEQALTKATDLSIMAGKALLRLAKEQQVAMINQVQTSAHALFASAAAVTSYTKTTTGKHVSAWQCINDIQSEAFAAHFHAEQIVVLLSDVYAASLGRIPLP